jgi:hypothetical protein
MMTTWSESDYYNIIDSSGSHLIVLGDKDEQWTIETLRLLEEGEVHVDLFPWGEISDLRLQLELASYPVVQLWNSGSMKAELLGHHGESLKNLIRFMKGQVYGNTIKGHGILN